MIEKKLVEILDPVVEQIVSLEKRIDAIKITPAEPGRDGVDGKDAAPEAVAEVLVSKHADVLRGAPGKDGADGRDGIGIKALEQDDDSKLKIVFDTDEVVEVVLPAGEKGAPGEPGKSVEVAEVVKALTGDEVFIEAVKADPADPELVAEALRADKTFCETIKGAGIDAEAWQTGEICRAGVWKMHNGGKLYQANRDTAAEPHEKHADWRRVGLIGSKHHRAGVDKALMEVGDSYIDGGSTFVLMPDGSGVMTAQRGATGKPGEKGERGFNGKDAPRIKSMRLTSEGGTLHLDDGSDLSFPFDTTDGFKSLVKEWTVEERQRELDELAERGIATLVFRGVWRLDQAYRVGDMVRYGKALWICSKNVGAQSPLLAPDWEIMVTGGGMGGGGGGGGGGLSRTTQIIADGTLNMGNFGIANLANPRNGQIGDADAVNKLYMQQAIAAGTLFQGVYRPAGNAPDLGAKGNTGFAAPAANTALFAPPGAPLKPTDPLRVAVWFQVPDVTFPLTLAAPKHVTITLSNGQAVEFNVPAATYADQNALIAAYLAAAKAANPLILNMIVHHAPGALWMAVETLPAVYATSMSGQIGGGFPVLPPGAANTILNSYSWNIQTTDPNLPEYLPAGLPGIAAGTKVNNSDLLQYNAGLQRFEIIRGGNLTQGFADNRYWQLAHGNMAWQDQAYDKGAVVYGVRFNAWFVATQNIVPGTPEPGTTAAAAVWRKINSTYGSTIFFGKGDYDTAPGHQDAAHNYGMPAGTYPAGQQPLNGDSYYDVTSGTEVQFTVTQNAPLFVITGVTTINPTNQVGTLNNAQMDAFLPAATPMVGQYYFYDAGTAHTALGGSFNGVAFAAGHKYYIVWSGDKDADHNGWVVVDGGTTAPAAGTTKNWSISTPHPQAVPDTITPKVVWGYKRNFSITVGALVHGDGDKIILLKHIPDTSGITHVELKHTAADGATYEFEVIVSRGSPTLISPVAIDSHNSLFETINVGKDATNGIFIYGVTKQAAGGLTINGENYLLEVTTYDYDTGVLEVGTGAEVTTVTPTDTVSGLYNYPGTALEKFFKDVQTGVARPYPLKQFDITVGPASAGAEYFILFYGIPLVNGVTHVEMRRKDANGSTYEFDIISVVAGGCTISPIAVKNQDSQFLEIMAGWYDKTYNYILSVKSKVKTTTEVYQVTLSSFDYDLDLVKPNSTLTTPGAQNYRHDFFKADSAYPGRELTDILKAMSAHETASVAGMSAVLYGGSNTEGPQTCRGNAKEAFGIWGNTGPWIGTNFNSADTAQFFEEWDPFTNGSTGHWGIKSNAHLFVKFSIQGWFSASNASDGYLCLFKVTAANIAAGHTERTNWEQLDYCPVPYTASTYMHIDLCGQSEPGDVIFISQNTGSASLTIGQWFRQNVTGWKGQ